ncbi:ABC transporter ATP-binding protein [Chelatococcus asaccharovorans]|uniref:Amino acid/amide ABC transporter ATP-binding protein 1 (HAAT family) n=1 Tax=Chelatococcus asaccharovorans TaxID=28210 RepID=A0A2V3UC29_9HYPH|nr:ABC transporter ATP-binding protein [Chelatococcus asaccharovorans]MBS7703655.1 ABC transporter ATP-binding protein [Chelatococcus asaccharovorans]PXW61999.1 amino acid/amide ABC transporter ATP-binding protein 1 (HAAT family) [Chelatococcus asaccharovorans]
MASEPFLAVDHIAKHFGGVKAVKDVTFTVNRGEILGLIGPNGAGKTTTFNLISGLLPLTGGEVRLEGRRISGERPDRIASLGVARTFQGTRIFPALTVRENLETALLARAPVGFWADWFGLPAARAIHAAIGGEVTNVLDFIGLSAQAERIAGDMPYAHQSLLGVGLALALKPRLLLLDEPFAGMNPNETAGAAAMVQRIRDSGVTVLFVEHDMAAVMGICDRIVVVDQGSKIAEGAPAEIAANPRVIEAYLGSDEDA